MTPKNHIFQSMKTVMEGLGQTLKGNMTNHVISESQMEGLDMIYFDDFLGNGDVDNQNKSVVCRLHVL